MEGLLLFALVSRPSQITFFTLNKLSVFFLLLLQIRVVRQTEQGRRPKCDDALLIRKLTNCSVFELFFVWCFVSVVGIEWQTRKCVEISQEGRSLYLVSATSARIKQLHRDQGIAWIVVCVSISFINQNFYCLNRRFVKRSRRCTWDALRTCADIAGHG